MPSQRQSASVSGPDLVAAVTSGGRRRSLEAIRDRLASDLEAAVGRDAAVIAKELRAVIDAIDKLPPAREVSTVDQLAARRKARRAKPTVPQRPEVSEHGGA